MGGMGLCSVVFRAPGAALLALAMASGATANDAQLIVGTGTEIPGTSKKIGGLSDAYVDDENVIFLGVDDLGVPGFGHFGITLFPKVELKWNPVSSTPLEKKASLSFPGYAYLANDAAGTPTIFGMADVESWNPIALVSIGDALPGGKVVTELGAFDLSGKKLVFSTDSGLYSIADIGAVGVAYETVVDTNTTAPGLGLFTKFEEVFTDATSVFFSATSERGAGAYLHTLGSLTTVADTTQEIPIENVTLNFQKIKAEAWTGKKAVIWGSADTDEGIFFMGEVIPKLELEVAADTTTPLPVGAGLFQKFLSVSATETEIAALAEGTDGSLSIYTGTDTLSKKTVFVGEDFVGKKFSTLSITDQALGSLIFTADFDDGSEGLLLAATATAVPLLPLTGLSLLLAVAIATVTYAWIVRGRQTSGHVAIGE